MRFVHPPDPTLVPLPLDIPCVEQLMIVAVVPAVQSVGFIPRKNFLLGHEAGLELCPSCFRLRTARQVLASGFLKKRPLCSSLRCGLKYSIGKRRCLSGHHQHADICFLDRSLDRHNGCDVPDRRPSALCGNDGIVPVDRDEPPHLISRSLSTPSRFEGVACRPQ
jgi:hypothetical protein